MPLVAPGGVQDIEGAAATKEGPLTDVMWRHRPPPPLAGRVTLVGRWTPAGVAELTYARRHLAAALSAEAAAGAVAAGAVERLLLVFEEVGSNALRHGGGPVGITITRSDVHWLVEVSDAGAAVAPAPAVGRDPAQGGLGLYVVARVCGDHGWFIEGDRKTVWARVDHTRAEAPPTVVALLPEPRPAGPRRRQPCS
jgi:hypothetical protein